MWNDANMITSFPNFYCAIHADAHKHHIKQIVHLTYARPMLCIYSIRLTLPYIVCPFSQNWPNFSRKLILEGPMATTPMVVSMKEVIRIHRYKTFGEWTPFGETLWKHLAPKLQKRSRYHLHPCPVWGIIRHLLDGLIPNDSHFRTIFRTGVMANLGKVQHGPVCVQCLSSLTFLWQWAVGDRSSWNSSQNISNAWRLQEDKGS